MKRKPAFLKNIFQKKFFCDEACSDVLYKNHIKFGTNNANYKFSKKAINYQTDKTKKANFILLIIESPHVDEYFDKNTKKENENFLAASGITGENIEKHFFDKVLVKVLDENDNKKYFLAIINSIKYQTSIGIKRKKEYIRDIIWSSLWNSKYNDLDTRLHWFTKPKNNVIFLNFCTESFNKRKDVSNYLHKNFPKSIIYEGSHPSSWELLLKAKKKISVKKSVKSSKNAEKKKKIDLSIHYYYK